MERFNSIYPFTTENIRGYMHDLDLTNKKVITVTGSGDHVLNAIAQGSKEITTFDYNPLTKYYLDLKLASIKELSLEEFKETFLYLEKEIDISFLKGLEMPKESKDYWSKQMSILHWTYLAHSSLFNRKYFNPNSKIWENIYLDEDKYKKVKNAIDDVCINYIQSNLLDLSIDKDYDYMFLSNISDYLYLMFKDNELEEYNKLLKKFQEHIENIYFAYVYDIWDTNLRTDIDDPKKVKKVFKNFERKEFDSALENTVKVRDSVLILRRMK